MISKYTKTKVRGFGWAWEFQPEYRGPWILCNWSQPFPSMLTDENKPSDEARKVRVELVPTTKRDRKRYGYAP